MLKWKKKKNRHTIGDQFNIISRRLLMSYCMHLQHAGKIGRGMAEDQNKSWRKNCISANGPCMETISEQDNDYPLFWIWNSKLRTADMITVPVKISRIRNRYCLWTTWKKVRNICGTCVTVNKWRPRPYFFEGPIMPIMFKMQISQWVINI